MTAFRKGVRRICYSDIRSLYGNVLTFPLGIEVFDNFESKNKKQIRNDLELLDSLKFKNKKQIRTLIRVLYGHKKDRGHIKQKYKKIIQEANMTIYKQFLGGIGFYGRF